jgi:hypothetical protein
MTLLPIVRRITLLTTTLAALAAPALADSPAARADSSDARARGSFQRFAESWMEKIRRLEVENRKKPTVQTSASGIMSTYRGYGDDFSIELRPTGQPIAPYIGLLRYTELVYSCVQERCSVASTVPVTEIFRYQDGQWIY